MAGDSAQIQWLMDNTMKLESPPRSAKQRPLLCEVVFCPQGIRIYIAQEKKRKEKKSNWRFLNDGLGIQALPAVCIVLILLIRLLVFGKKTSDL